MRMWLTACFAAGCFTDPPPTQNPTPPVVNEPPPRPAGDLPYPLDEAVADALASPLTHVATGPWFGIYRVDACMYRNDRVLVVDVYCTTKEMSSFRVDVFSPTRGRVTIYAEATKPISTLTRADYFTFKAEVEPATNIPRITLDMPLTRLRAADEARYKKTGPACWGGIEIVYRAARPTGQCRGELEPKGAAWSDRNLPFLTHANGDWYRLVRELRAQAVTNGKHVAHPGG
jgi:hypothetical protein